MGYTRPKITTNSSIHKVIGGRHPVVELFQMSRGNDFIINDSLLAQNSKIVLLTVELSTHFRTDFIIGPQHGRQVDLFKAKVRAVRLIYLVISAIISIMAQTGLYVPCLDAELSIIDQIFTRIGSSDDLSANQSTFMVEMKETANILKNATSNSLVIMDEVGRGTSTKDGISLALSILDHLKTINKSMCIFATHYHELCKMISERDMKGISFYQAACILDENKRLTCLHKIVPGVMDRSHGIQIAEMAGLPTSVIRKAQTIHKSIG